MKKNRFLYYMFILVFLIQGCASPKVKFFSGNSYPAKEENASIDIFTETRPTKEYIEFAYISCGDTSDKWNRKQILKKAHEIGADGIIITGKLGTYRSGSATI